MRYALALFIGLWSSVALADGLIVPGGPPTGAAGGDLSGTYPSPGVAKTGGVAFGPAATAVAGQYPGVTSNTPACAGCVGEVIPSTVAFGSAVSMTSPNPINMTSINITAGEWLVYCSCQFVGATSTGNSQFVASISSTTGALSVDQVDFSQSAFDLGTSGQTVVIGPVYVSVASTTTYYAVVRGSFTSGPGTLKAYGKFFAVRLH